MTLTLASLFDGIGGFCLALERAGARTVATVEQGACGDPVCEVQRAEALGWMADQYIVAAEARADA